jgi:PAS domain S-box-containing protein
MPTSGTSSPVPDAAPRLFLLDAPPAAVGSYQSRWPGVVVRVAPGWVSQAFGLPAPTPQDVFLFWHQPPDVGDLSRLVALRTHHPRTPLVARAPRGSAAAQQALLAAGVQEVVYRAADLPTAIAKARSRVAALAGDAARREADETPSPSYERLFPNLYDWIYVIGVAEDGGMTFETVNPPLHPASDLLRAEYAGQSPDACLPESTAAAMNGHLLQVLTEGRPLRFEEEQSVGGQTRSFETTLTPVRNKWGRIHRIAGLSRDITALKEAQAALRASEERLAHALEGTQQGLWDWDLVRGAVYRSPRWFEMLGLRTGDVEDTLDAGLALVHPDDRRGVEQAFRLHLDGHLPRFQAEYRLRTGSGDWLWVFDAGKAVRWMPDGRAARIAGLCTDITERRRAEESLRALVGGVVHEMRNPAFGIGVNLDALEATFGDEPRYRPFVAALRESCTRILSLMNDLRDYGEPRSLRAEPCRVRAVLGEAASSCAGLARERDCRVRINFEDENLVLPLHAVRMHQVFRNLLENALFHSPPGSDVVVRCRTERHQGDAGEAMGPQALAQDWWVCSVEDRGTGFDQEALARAFEPFFTRRKGGTGLGLSIVRRVVEEHGGSVEARNRPDGGALVSLRLPMSRVQHPVLSEE